MRFPVVIYMRPIISFAYNGHVICHCVDCLIVCPMVQVPCPYGVWFMRYGLFSNGSSFTYCRQCILVIYYIFLVKSKNGLKHTHFITGAEIWAYNGFYGVAPFWPMGGHPPVGGPHWIWPPI